MRSDDLNKSDIEILLLSLTHMEYTLLVKPNRTQGDDEAIAKALLIKQKLIRAKDGIDIQKDMDNEERREKDG